MLAAEVALVLGRDLARIVANFASYEFPWDRIHQYEMYVSHTWTWCTICGAEVTCHNIIIEGGGAVRRVCDDCHISIIWPAIVRRRGFFWWGNPNGGFSACYARIWLKKRSERHKLNPRRRRKCRAANYSLSYSEAPILQFEKVPRYLP